VGPGRSRPTPASPGPSWTRCGPGTDLAARSAPSSGCPRRGGGCVGTGWPSGERRPPSRTHRIWTRWQASSTAVGEDPAGEVPAERRPDVAVAGEQGCRPSADADGVAGGDGHPRKGEDRERHRRFGGNADAGAEGAGSPVAAGRVGFRGLSVLSGQGGLRRRRTPARRGWAWAGAAAEMSVGTPSGSLRKASAGSAAGGGSRSGAERSRSSCTSRRSVSLAAQSRVNQPSEGVC